MVSLDTAMATNVLASMWDTSAVRLYLSLRPLATVGAESLLGDINTNGSKNNFKLPSSARKSLSEILIVHPVAAFLTLICLFMAIAAHFHAPSHSPRFLLTLLILFLPTLLVSLLAFLVDILLFIPHLQWGGWIVLVATVILVSCGVVTCAMRRTLVSRKARKHRIAENAEMSGENFYNRQNAAANVAAQEPSMPNIETKEAIVSGSSEPGPTFAAFRTNTRTSDDDRTPLNLGPLNDIPPPDRRGTPYSGPTDEAGNLMPPGPYGAGPSDPRMRQYSDGSIGSWRGGGPPPPGFGPRGRGAYPPRGGYGRGGPHMGPRGPPPPGARGGYMGPRGRGGMMRGRGPPRGPPPDGYDSYGRPMPSPGGDPYGSDPYGAGAPPPTGPPRQQTPGPIGMAFSDPELVDQAIEMTPQNRHLSDPSMDPGPHALSIDGQHMPLESPTSQYSRPE